MFVDFIVCVVLAFCTTMLFARLRRRVKPSDDEENLIETERRIDEIEKRDAH
jgi:membrane protein implicated in regulation of membrane protease activity